MVVVSVPRQTGKTTLLRAVGAHSCLVCGRDVFYTAQTGKDARERWLDLVKILRVNDALADRVKIGLRGGSEQVVFTDTGAAFRVFAPTPESLHGYTPPKVMIDEAFAQTGMSGELLMGAIGPAQITIRDRQIWIVSTAGTAESTFLHDWIDRGVEGTPRVAAFVWGARDDQNPTTSTTSPHSTLALASPSTARSWRPATSWSRPTATPKRSTNGPTPTAERSPFPT